MNKDLRNTEKDQIASSNQQVLCGDAGSVTQNNYIAE